MIKRRAQNKLDKVGIEAICDAIINGVGLTALCESIGVDIASYSNWLARDPQRSARARDARISTAQLWDALAESRIAQAQDAFELAKAKDLAHHYRWRASKIAPRDYGDRQQIELNDITEPKTREQLEARLAILQAKAEE